MPNNVPCPRGDDCLVGAKTHRSGSKAYNACLNAGNARTNTSLKKDDVLNDLLTPQVDTVDLEGTVEGDLLSVELAGGVAEESLESALDLVEKSQEERKKWEDEVAHALSDETGEEALELMNAIHQDSAYHDLLATANLHNKEWDSHNRKFGYRYGAITKALDAGKEYKDANVAYEEAQLALVHSEAELSAKEESDHYLTMLAQLAHHADEKDALGITPFDGESIGDMVRGAEFSSASREWLEYRQGGIGGSDLNSLNEDNPYHKQNMVKLWESKVNPIPEEQVEFQKKAHEEFDNPISRGNAFEGYAAHLHAAKHGQNLIRSKGTWINDDDNIRLNYDLMVADENGNPLHPLEVKTASSGKKWGPDGSGLDGIPVDYRDQLLAQIHKGGFDKGQLTVLIAGTESRSYHVDMDDELRDYIEEKIDNADEYYLNAKAAREGRPHVVPPLVLEAQEVKVRNPFKAAVTKSADADASKTPFFREVALLSGKSEEEVASDYTSRISKTSGEPEDITGTINQMYKDINPTDISQWSGIDLETTALYPTRGQIIELGATGPGNINELYSPTEAHGRRVGTGASDVHNIHMSDVEGKKNFSDPEVQQQTLKALMNNGNPIVAHNASFEDRFLTAHLKGYAEARAEGKIKIVDTMNVVQLGMDNGLNEKATMAAFMDKTGIEYEGAHRAYADADMMMRGLNKWAESQRNK